MSFKIGDTTFGFTMRVPASDEIAVDDLFSSHAKWMSETQSLEPESGNCRRLSTSFKKRLK